MYSKSQKTYRDMYCRGRSFTNRIWRNTDSNIEAKENASNDIRYLEHVYVDGSWLTGRGAFSCLNVF